MSSRAERRRQMRGSDPGGPKHRDPMRNVYIGFAVAIVAVFLIFALFNLKQKHDVDVAVATPTPGPNATSSAIPLKEPGPGIGKEALAPNDEKGGGAGGPVDGIQCETMEQAVYHIHSHLALFVNGRQIQIPSFVGIVPQGNGGCLYWVHTHAATGIIHIEAPEIRPYNLGNFFHIWGEDLNRNQVATFHGPVTAFVNGAKYDGDLAAIPLSAHNEITLEVGTPVVLPPHYQFPARD